MLKKDLEQEVIRLRKELSEQRQYNSKMLIEDMIVDTIVNKLTFHKDDENSVIVEIDGRYIDSFDVGD